MERLAKLGVKIPDILVPAETVEMRKWAVVACDQYTSEPEYWERVDTMVGDAPSTLRMIFPECFLESGDAEKRIASIHQAMRDNLERETFRTLPSTMVLVERESPNAPKRTGLIVALDLEAYDYSADSQSLIRATEGTILDRIPPRKRIRVGAPIEFPHIMVLLDDPERRVIEGLRNYREETLYDFDLMENSGHLKGSAIANPVAFSFLADGLEQLLAQARTRYPDKAPILFAMGDGNHSLATAKSVWEEMKPQVPENERTSHPARFALVELVNIYDQGIEFEPIHKVLFDVDPMDVLTYLEKTGFVKKDPPRSFHDDLLAAGPIHRVGFLHKSGHGHLEIADPSVNVSAGSLQAALDDYLSEHPSSRIDYVHGLEATERLGAQDNNLSFFLAPLDKEDFFASVIRDGALPRKTFSMGEAEDKRFYVEGRRILPKQ